MDDIEARAVGVLEGLDEAGNALLGPKSGLPEAGNPHYTMSQRWAYERAAGSRTACVICQILTWMFKPFYWNVPGYDHCSEAIKDFPTNLPHEG